MVLLKKAPLFFLAIALLAVFSSACVSRMENSPDQYANSSAITFQVKEKLLRDPHIKSYTITVNTFKDTVTLGGSVRSQKEEERVIDITRSVKGVKYVVDNMAIKNA